MGRVPCVSHHFLERSWLLTASRRVVIRPHVTHFNMVESAHASDHEGKRGLGEGSREL